jgi:uncharacterized membrane protein SpoIIM required for sporulation
MISNRWIELRQSNWNKLDSLLQLVESGGLKTMSSGDLRDLGLLYRQAAADLSTVREDKASRTLEGYLNRLVSRAHNYIYAGASLSPASLWHFLVHAYPRIFRRLGRYVAVSLLIGLAGALLGALVTLARPNFMHAMLGPDMIEKIEHHQMWTESILTAKPQESSHIMTNNISVCFMTFASGIVFGLGTIFLLFTNGLNIGVLGVACGQHGMSLSLWSFVAAHGALELPAIFISGAAGLRLATGLLFPGMLRRKDALALAGSESVRLVSATIPMLIVAGTLEAFLSPTHAPIALKFAVCAALLTGLSFWLSEGGRTQKSTVYGKI